MLHQRLHVARAAGGRAFLDLGEPVEHVVAERAHRSVRRGLGLQTADVVVRERCRVVRGVSHVVIAPFCGHVASEVPQQVGAGELRPPSERAGDLAGGRAARDRGPARDRVLYDADGLAAGREACRHQRAIGRGTARDACVRRNQCLCVTQRRGQPCAGRVRIVVRAGDREHLAVDVGGGAAGLADRGEAAQQVIPHGRLERSDLTGAPGVRGVRSLLLGDPSGPRVVLVFGPDAIGSLDRLELARPVELFLRHGRGRVVGAVLGVRLPVDLGFLLGHDVDAHLRVRIGSAGGGDQVEVVEPLAVVRLPVDELGGLEVCGRAVPLDLGQDVGPSVRVAAGRIHAVLERRDGRR